jgi:hypothetical protein
MPADQSRGALDEEIERSRTAWTQLAGKAILKSIGSYE